MANKILIGDDDSEIRNNLKRFLGIEADFAETAEAVIDLAKANNYDKIVTDLDYTPNGNEGFELLKAIRELAPIRILYTAKARVKGVKEKAEQNGATHVIPKEEMYGLIKLLRS